MGEAPEPNVDKGYTPFVTAGEPTHPYLDAALPPGQRAGGKYPLKYTGAA